MLNASCRIKSILFESQETQWNINCLVLQSISQFLAVRFILHPEFRIPHFLSLKWWAKMDSNHRPHDYQSCALASWAIGPYWWRLAGSNRWPPACKAGALPAELNPHLVIHFVNNAECWMQNAECLSLILHYEFWIMHYLAGCAL